MILVFVFVAPVGLFSAQHDYNIANNPGAVVRSDINSALDAIATNNSGAVEPATTFSNQWWFDTSTNIMKQRNNGNDDWVLVALKNVNGWTPYRQGTLIGTGSLLTTDTDVLLAANSDSNVATQKAAKTYADTGLATKISKTIAGEINAMSEKVSPVADDIIVIEDSADSYSKKKVKKSSFTSITGIEIFTSNGTFVCPAGVDYVSVFLIGGGGGGGGGFNDNGAGGGAAAASMVDSVFYPVTPSSSYTVIIGAGGSGGSGSATGSNGSAGGSSSFDGILAVGGGSPGSGTTGDGGGDNEGIGGTGASDSASRNATSSTGAAISSPTRGGGDGADGSYQSSGGGGGAPYFLGAGGNGGSGVDGAGESAAANSGGGGGGGAWGGSGGSPGGAGGSGGSGLCIVTW